MSDNFSIPSTPSAMPPAPRKTNPWVIVVVVVVVLCCLCFGGIGLLWAFGQDLLNSFGIYVLAPLAILA